MDVPIDEKAKIEVFGDSFAEHDTKWLGSVTFIEYVAGTFKHYLGRVPRQMWQAAMGSKEQPAAASGAGAKETSEAEAVRPLPCVAPAKSQRLLIRDGVRQAAEESATFSPMDMLKGIKSSVDALGKDMASLQRKLDDTRVVASSIAARRAEGEDPDAGRDALLQKVEYLTELMGTILQHQEEAARQNVPDGPSKSDE